MTVFLTGGSGFLGSHVAEVLLEKGHKVIALVRRTSNTKHLSSLGVELCYASLDDIATLRQPLARCEAVVHVAGLVKAIRPSDFFRVNVEGTRNLAKAASECLQGRRFILVSSIAARGPSKDPFPTPDGIAEGPVTAYGRSKLEGERALLEFQDRLECLILRPPIIYGPRDYEFLRLFKVAARYRFIPVAEPDQVVTMIHARDCATAIAALLDLPSPTRKVYPVNDGETYTWDRIASVVGDVIGRRVRTIRMPLPILKAVAFLWQTYGLITKTPVVMSLDKMREATALYWVDSNEALRKETGWTPAFGLREGVSDTLAWATANNLL